MNEEFNIVIDGLINSQEFKQKVQDTDTWRTAYIKQLYKAILYRDPQNTEITYWLCIMKDRTPLLVYNEKQYGSLEIIKKGNNGTLLSGVSFRITGPNGYDKTFTTGSDGKITVTNLFQGDYTITETSVGNNYGYIVENGAVKVTIKAGEKTSKEFTNKYQLSPIRIVKSDKSTGKAMANIGFTLKMTSGLQNGKYVGIDGTGNATYSTTPQTITTNANGQLNINKAWPGNYILTETVNPYEGYEELPKVVSQGTIGVNTALSLTIENERKYVKVSGYSWEDRTWQEGKTEKYNQLYKDGTLDVNDKLISGVVVKLMKDGKEVERTTTDSNGKYTFKKVLISELANYYIEFEYNGMSYIAVTKYENKTNGNKAEEPGRQEFNNKFATIEKDYAKPGVEGEGYKLEYQEETKEGTLTSTLTYGANSKYSYEGQKYPVYAGNSQYNITSKTNNIQVVGQAMDSSFMEKVKNGTITTIENINLGLKEREQPDLALANDIEDIRLTINGYEHIYDYGKKGLEENSTDFNVSVVVNNKNKVPTYTRELYKSDISYNMDVGNQDSNRLQVYVTYKMLVLNEASNIPTRVNKIDNYYDARYTIEKIGTSLDAQGNINDSKQLLESDVVQDSNYKKARINLNATVEGQKATAVYIEFKLNDEAVLAVLNGEQTLENVAEVVSYSSLTKDGKAYGGIDLDSQPENAVPGNTATYEDDTDKAPSLILEVKNGREIEGTIWEDSTVGELLAQNNVRLGNGQYEEGTENVISNVKVEMLTRQTDAQGNYQIARLHYYNSSLDTVIEKNATTTTGKDGKYKFEGVIPGEYFIRFTYGNTSVICDTNGNPIQNVKVMEYKSTIQSKNIDYNNKYWYETEVDTRYSDAKDELETRRQMDNIEIVNNNYNEQTAREMTANTAPFEIRIEYTSTQTSSGVDKYVQTSKNIDFGIIERAHQEIKTIKEISKIKITLANGQILIEGDPRGGNLPYVKALPGIVYAEIDESILHGATLEITYEIRVENSGEMDYATDEYYIYGTIPNNPNEAKAKITITKLVDYISNDVSYEEQENSVWKTTTVQKLKEEGRISEEVAKKLEGYTTILETESIGEIERGESKTVEIKTGRLLTNSDKLTYENNAEIIGIKNATGYKITQIPGDYVPGEGPYEGDEGEITISITSPTGENKNYMPWIITGVSSLIILGVGIVLIKRKIVK